MTNISNTQVVAAKTEDITTKDFLCSSNNKLEALDNDALQEFLQDCATSSNVVTPVSEKKTPGCKRKREDAEQDIAKTQREILRKIRSIAETQSELLHEMKIRNSIEHQKLQFQQFMPQ